MVVLTYNVGSISGTRLIANHRAGNYEAARLEFDHIWVRNPTTGAKEASRGLVNRRCAERKLYAVRTLITLT